MSQQWEWQKRKHAQGLCVTCGKPAGKAVGGTSWHCARHAAYVRKKVLEYYYARKARKEEEQQP